MNYQLLFCLASDDNGAFDNPLLGSLVDADGRPQLFESLDDAHRALSRLRRLGDDLIYYVAAVSAMDTAINTVLTDPSHTPPALSTSSVPAGNFFRALITRFQGAKIDPAPV